MPQKQTKALVEATRKANEAINAGKWDRVAPSDAVHSVLFDDLKDAAFGPAIANILSGGDAVIFGATRDGGAIAITILAGTDKRKIYAADADELDRVLKAIASA